MEQAFLNIVSHPAFYALAVLWTTPWKGVALWKSAKNGHKKWFIALLILNTLAILEIIYIFYFSKPKQNAEQSDRGN